MTERTRKNHFGAKIAQRMQQAQRLLEEEPQDEEEQSGEVWIWPRVKPIEAFWSELEQRIRDGEAGD